MNHKTKNMTCVLKNVSSKVYYIPQYPQLSYAGDTLYTEALYLKNGKYDETVKPNQFSPRSLIRLNPNSIAKLTFNCENFSDKMLHVLSVSVYNKPYPYSPQKDYVKYHSLNEFLRFEEKFSFKVFIKIN